MFSLLFQYNTISYADTTLPLKYDLRDYDRAVPVKDQGKIRSCWAFSTFSSLESNMKNTRNISIDFSENNMINNHGFDLSEEGNFLISTAYLSSWKGPVLEEKDPYPSTGLKSDMLNRGIMPADYHVQNILFLPKRNNSNDNDKIKRAVMQYGEVYTSMQWDSHFLNVNNNSYRNTISTQDFGHTVDIVGWDDNYPKENFNSNENCTDGAFICKLSEGTDWVDNGYIYVSYSDVNIGYEENVIFLAPEDKNNYDNIYQYDEFGKTSEYECNLNTLWFSNVFVANKGYNEKLSAASFYTCLENTDYEIYICKDFKDINSFKNKIKIASGQIEYMGYHTIPFKSFDLKQNEKYAVIVKLTTRNKKQTIALEYPNENFTGDKVSSNKNESFISFNGNIWEDVTNTMKNTNVCLKAFTKNGDAKK